MGGKDVRAVIMCVLILGQVVAQIEAKTCCINPIGRTCYISCRAGGTQSGLCARFCTCIVVGQTTCPRSHPISGDAIEGVTTGTEAYPTSVTCPNPKAKACFSRCRLAPWACANECGCRIIHT